MRHALLLIGLIGCAGEKDAVVLTSVTIDRGAAFSLDVDGEQHTWVSCYVDDAHDGTFGLYTSTRETPRAEAVGRAFPSEEWIGRTFAGLGELIDVDVRDGDAALQDAYRADDALRFYTIVAPANGRFDVELEIRTNVAEFGEIDVTRDSAPATLEWVFGGQD